jgi:hypothetical protein
MRSRLLGLCAAIVGLAACSASLDPEHQGAAGSGGAGSVGTTGLGGRAGGSGGAGDGAGLDGGATGLGGNTGGAGFDGGATGLGGGAGTTFIGPRNNEVDILFMIDNSAEMTEMQEKLYAQLPLFLQLLQSLAVPPSLHIAVVSSDMGAPSDSANAIECTAKGDQGEFQYLPRSDSSLDITCTDTTLAPGDTFISDADMMPNYTDPIGTVLQCIALLGDQGCGFEHQLASIDRALGADGQGPPPSTNADFLRPEAALAIVILTNEDDCSAPANTQLYSLNGGQQNIANPLGPIANYRCNQFGHLCSDPITGAVIAPPLVPPADAQGTAAAPTLALTNCTSNDTGTGLLTPVARFISDVKALKPDPDNQIVVAAIAAPAAPYTVAWAPASGGQNTKPGELWPELEHSCGAAGGDVNPAGQISTDGSFGDPGVRIAEFVNAFPRSYLESVCDPTYTPALSAVAARIAQLIDPS